MHAVFFIPYVEPQCRSECWVDVNHDSDLIWIPPDLFSLSQKNLLARSQSFPSLGLCCLALLYTVSRQTVLSTPQRQTLSILLM